MKNQDIKKIIKPLLLPVALGIVAWESLVYKPIKAISNFLEKNEIIHKMSDKIRNANPYVSLAILLGGALPLLPFKIAGLYLIGHGYKALGIGTFGLAKVVGGGIGVHLFNLTEPSIRKIKIVNTTLDFAFSTKDKIKKVLTEMPAYIQAKELIHNSKNTIKDYLKENEIIKKFFEKKDNSHEVIKKLSIVEEDKTIITRVNEHSEILSEKISRFVKIEEKNSNILNVIKEEKFELEVNNEKSNPLEKLKDNINEKVNNNSPEKKKIKF